MGADPARAYLFDGGVVVFGQQQRAGQSNDALIVNLWTQDRSAAAPWSLAQLEGYLAAQSSNSSSSSDAGASNSSGARTADAAGNNSGAGGGAGAVRRLRSRLHASVAASLAAALPNVRRSAAALPGFQGGSFEVLGIDFLVDASLQPWLVEVNFLPSMARKLVGCNATSAPTASGSSSAACQQENPFDVQKERFVQALLGLLGQRHRQLGPAERQAQQLLRAASAAAAEGDGPPCVDAAQLRQVVALPGEQAAARALGFVPLTKLMYRCLECAASRQQQPSTEGRGGEAAGAASSGRGTGAECEVLAELAPPLDGSAQEHAQRQCSAPASFSQQLLATVQRWRERLLLEGAALAPWVLNPRARWRAARSEQLAPPPFPMLPADRRLLAWLRRGSPPLDSQQAVRDFCAAAA